MQEKLLSAVSLTSKMSRSGSGFSRRFHCGASSPRIPKDHAHFPAMSDAEGITEEERPSEGGQPSTVVAVSGETVEGASPLTPSSDIQQWRQPPTAVYNGKLYLSKKRN